MNASISDVDENEFQIFPNPASEHLTIVTAKPTNGTTTIEFLAVDGKLVSTNSFQGNSEVELNVSDMNPGIYFVRISNEKSTQTQRFIIN